MKRSICLLLWALPTLALSQQATVASGGESQGTGGSVSYTIGQVAYQSLSNNSWQINEGVQQPIEIYQMSAVNETPSISLQIGPNPSINEVFLIGEHALLNQLSIELFDLQGKRIKAQQRVEADGKIDLSTIPAASYQLVIYQNNQAIRNYKLIKHSSL